MKKIIFIIVLIAIGLIIYKFNYCNYNPTKPTIFYPIYTRLDTCMKYEAFVVSNAPCDTSLLKRLIEKFDIETLSIDTLNKYESIDRIFYKETKYMTKDFKEGDEYKPTFNSWDNIKDFRNHIDDILAQTHYYSVNFREKYYTFWANWDWDYKKGNKFINRTKELYSSWDSLFTKKRKLYDKKQLE